eukprot:2713602-Pleurochrysis_carterae.AAC.5
MALSCGRAGACAAWWWRRSPRPGPVPTAPGDSSRSRPRAQRRRWGDRHAHARAHARRHARTHAHAHAHPHPHACSSTASSIWRVHLSTLIPCGTRYTHVQPYACCAMYLTCELRRECAELRIFDAEICLNEAAGNSADGCAGTPIRASALRDPHILVSSPLSASY